MDGMLVHDDGASAAHDQDSPKSKLPSSRRHAVAPVVVVPASTLSWLTPGSTVVVLDEVAPESDDPSADPNAEPSPLMSFCGLNIDVSAESGDASGDAADVVDDEAVAAAPVAEAGAAALDAAEEDAAEVVAVAAVSFSVEAAGAVVAVTAVVNFPKIPFCERV